MTTVAIIGAGELGGAAAQALAARDRVGRVLLIDDAAGVAAGKALDILQAGAVTGSGTRLSGTADLTSVTGVQACLLADRAASGSPEWQGEDGLALLRRLVQYASGAPIVFAGSGQAELMEGAARELGVARERLVGSAPEAFASAVRAIVALEARCAPDEVMLTVLGTPPDGFVVPWSEACIGGYGLLQVLAPVQVARVEARAARLWPPGAYTMGHAAARVIEAMLLSSRRTYSVLTVLGGEFGVRDRAGALPAILGGGGIVHSRVPTLNTRERVRLETALGR